jgi:hypothetical protein
MYHWFKTKLHHLDSFHESIGWERQKYMFGCPVVDEMKTNMRVRMAVLVR